MLGKKLLKKCEYNASVVWSLRNYERGKTNETASFPTVYRSERLTDKSRGK